MVVEFSILLFLLLLLDCVRFWPYLLAVYIFLLHNQIVALRSGSATVYKVVLYTIFEFLKRLFELSCRRTKSSLMCFVVFFHTQNGVLC